MAGLQRLSESLYHALCMKVGTRQQVCMRRDVVDMAEIIKYIGQPFYVSCKMNSGSSREGFRLSGSDIDTMVWFKNDKVINDLSQFKEYNHLPKITLILMECEQSPPGFVLLRLLFPAYIYRGREQLWTSCVRMNDRFFISSTLYREQMCSVLRPNSTVHGPCSSGFFLSIEYDDAHCFKCDFWPQSALPMIQRCQTWPPLLVLHDIYNSGCHLVAKGSTLSPHEDNEWRISFSQAEQKLVYSMNHSQFLVYGLLKLFLKEVINQNVNNKLLCSYFMKTVVFWEIGENKIPCWCPQNIVVCFWSCFKHIIQWVYHGNCPNFFIPENNMFAGKIVGNKQHNLFQQLYGLYKRGYTCLLLSPSVRSYVVQFLCNPTVVVNVNGGPFMSVEGLDIEMHFEAKNRNYLRFEPSNICMKFLQILEHFTQTPLTQYHRIMLQKFTSYTFKFIAFHLHNTCRDKTSTKMMYITDRISCHMLKLAAKFGSVADMLYIAMYYYRTCRYTKALSIIEKTKVRLSRYQDAINNERYVNASFSKGLRECVMNDIQLNSEICYIDELRLEQQISLTNRGDILCIPSQVMLHMLSVLCYNHVNTVRRQQALNDLYVLLHHGMDYLYELLRDIPEEVRDISYQILGMCQEICGDRLNAVHSYQESLRQFPYHMIKRATQIRIQHVLKQLYT